MTARRVGPRIKVFLVAFIVVPPRRAQKKQLGNRNRSAALLFWTMVKVVKNPVEVEVDEQQQQQRIAVSGESLSSHVNFTIDDSQSQMKRVHEDEWMVWV